MVLIRMCLLGDGEMKKILTLILMMSLLATLSACGSELNKGPENTAYEDLPHINHYRDLKTYDEMDTMYILYIYALWCGACFSLTPDILTFIEDHGSDVPIVFAEEGANGTPPVQWRSYPTMIVMKSGEVLEGPVVGTTDIRTLLSDIESGTYQP